MLDNAAWCEGLGRLGTALRAKSPPSAITFLEVSLNFLSRVESICLLWNKGTRRTLASEYVGDRSVVASVLTDCRFLLGEVWEKGGEAITLVIVAERNGGGDGSSIELSAVTSAGSVATE